VPRTYHVASEQADVDAFDVMLDYIDPDWHEQLTRTGP
jgi:cobyrinic acid a,c-diamide synthase